VIDRYILRQLLVAAAIGLALLIFAIWLTQSLRFIEVLTQSQAGAGALFSLVFLAMPELIGSVLPYAVGGAALFVYALLGSNAELVVMRASGRGPLALARPALLLAAGALVAHTVLNLVAIPIARGEFRDLRLRIETEFAAAVLREGTFNDVEDGLTVYVRDRGSDGVLRGILVHDTRDPEQDVSILAERGTLVSTPDGPEILLSEGSLQTRTEGEAHPDILFYDSYAFALDVGGDPLSRWREPDERFIGDLLSPSEEGLDPGAVRHLQAWGHQRLSTPLLSLAFVCMVVGALFAGQTNRRGQTGRMILAVAGMITLQAAMILFFSLAAEASAAALGLYAAPGLAILGGLAAMLTTGRGRRAGVPAAGITPA